MQERSGAKTAVVVLASVLLLVGLIVLVYIYFSDQSAPNSIILPSTQITGPVDAPPSVLQTEEFATMHAENVMDVLDTLHPVSAYRQVLNLTEYWQDGSATRIVEVYHRGDVTRVTVQAAKKTQHYLTDGKIVYTWYAGDTEAVSIPLREELTFADLMGVPDYYEALRDAPVQEVSFLPADEQSGDRIYAVSEQHDGREYCFWIDIETALLQRAELKEGEHVIHSLVQRELEILMPGDVLLIQMLRLPDGSDPFAH